MKKHMMAAVLDSPFTFFFTHVCAYGWSETKFGLVLLRAIIRNDILGFSMQLSFEFASNGTSWSKKYFFLGFYMCEEGNG